jgi:hypothetical protein
MNSAELLSLFRHDVDDVVEPYFWSDGEIIGYMDDAQKMFCRLTHGIRDATSPMCTIDIEPGEPFAYTDPRILRIARMQRDSDAALIRVVNVEDLETLQIKLDLLPGPVGKCVIGMQPHTIRWVRVPVLRDTASMVVDRLPLATLSLVRSTNLEIEEQHHRHLMLWMASLAYAKQDADTMNTNKAGGKEAQFRAYCAAAEVEKARARHKTRIVAYGGL